MAFEELKQRQSFVWGNGEFERISETGTDIYDAVVEALPAVPGERWLDLACGTGPISESTKRVGRASKTSWGIEGKAAAPPALAFTGSKSTNHARNIARASRSSARPVRRF